MICGQILQALRPLRSILSTLQKFFVAVAEYMHMCLQDRGKAGCTIYVFLRSLLLSDEINTRF